MSAGTFVGTLEAGLQGASEYQSGGIGPLFREERTEEPLGLLEFLSRVVAALRKVGVTAAVSLFVDEAEVYTDPEAAENNLDELLAAAREAARSEEAGSFHLMLAHEDEELWHIISIEGSVDHPADEAALTVLDTAKFFDEEEGEEETADGDELADEEEVLEDQEPDIVVDETDGETLVEAFLRRLLTELHKELALDEPELEVWTDWQGEYDPERLYSSALPGVGGFGGPGSGG